MRVIVEIRVPHGLSPEAVLSMASHELKVPGFKIDKDYGPISAPPNPESNIDFISDQEEIMLVRGELEDGQEQALKRKPCVIAVWSDAQVESFNAEDQFSPSDLIF